MWRQGDVLVVPVESIPENVKPVKRENGNVVLAHGEVTGHAHAIKSEHAALFSDPTLMAIFMTVGTETVLLEHQEHETISIPPGNYRVIRQREYHPGELRQVED
jgi:hypothetical protein